MVAPPPDRRNCPSRKGEAEGKEKKGSKRKIEEAPKKVVPTIRYEVEPRVLRIKASDFKAVVQKLTGMPTPKGSGKKITGGERKDNSSNSSSGAERVPRISPQPLDPFRQTPLGSSSSEPFDPFRSSSSFDQLQAPTFRYMDFSRTRYDSDIPSSSRNYIPRVLSDPRYTSDPRLLDPMQIGRPSTQLSTPMTGQPNNMNILNTTNNNMRFIPTPSTQLSTPIRPSTNNNMRFMPTPSTRPSGSSMRFNSPGPSHAIPIQGYNMHNVPMQDSVQDNFNNHISRPLSHPIQDDKSKLLSADPFNMHNPSPDSVQAGFNNHIFSGPSPLSQPNMPPSTSKPLSPTGTGFSSVPLFDDDDDDDLRNYLPQLYPAFDYDDDDNDGF